MNEAENRIELSVVVIVVSGTKALRGFLTSLQPQLDPDTTEVIVPYDLYIKDVTALAGEFPNVLFQYVGESLGNENQTPLGRHRLFDRRRAVGLGVAKGKIIALAEDHAQPANDWCKKLLEIHNQPYDVIGGAIENNIDSPLNWAVYYLDFGRYGRPFKSRVVNYVSDVNVSYKRRALDGNRDIWNGIYHETTLHWTLMERGSKLFLDERAVMYQERPSIPLMQAVHERYAWGRLFAETRVEHFSFSHRLFFIAGSVLLPLLLTLRAAGHMIRQRRSVVKIAATLPIMTILAASWSLGELAGYIIGGPLYRQTESALPGH